MARGDEQPLLSGLSGAAHLQRCDAGGILPLAAAAMHGRISVLLSGSRVLMKTKRVTIKDIAELAGVSKATASPVLNGRGKELRVAQETRERVLAIAREQHYQPSIHARSLRDNRSHTIGLVVPEITNYGFAVFSHELETLCREAGVQLLISCTDENPVRRAWWSIT